MWLLLSVVSMCGIKFDSALLCQNHCFISSQAVISASVETNSTVTVIIIKIINYTIQFYFANIEVLLELTVDWSSTAFRQWMLIEISYQNQHPDRMRILLFNPL